VGNSRGRLNVIESHLNVATSPLYSITDSGSILSFLGPSSRAEHRSDVITASRVFYRRQAQSGAWSVTFGTQLYAHPDAFNGILPLCNLRHIVLHILLFVSVLICKRHVPQLQLMTIASPLPIPYHGVSVAGCSAAVCLILFTSQKLSHVEYIGTILSVNRGVERRTRRYFSDQVVRSQETRRAGRDGRYCSRLSQTTSGYLRRIRS
jgi:hypothetical protein